MFSPTPSKLRSNAERLAKERLEAVAVDSIFRSSHKNYTKYPPQNLIPGVEMTDFEEDLRSGAGNELKDRGNEPAKFCAAFSSSALAVNVFGPFRRGPQQLDLAGYTGFTKAQFEKRLPTGLSGTDPHVDFYAAGSSAVVCVESKFLEILWPKEAKFADSYSEAIERLAEPAWSAVYLTLKANPQKYRFLDAAQLVKHYLGMRYSLGHLDTAQVLMYLYWEPENAEEFDLYLEHRTEVADFNRAIDGGEIAFVSQSYARLWADWRKGSEWDGMIEHLDHLEQRYSFALR